MRTTRLLNSFKTDYKRETKGKSKADVRQLDNDLAAALSVLTADEALSARYFDHQLTGQWKDCRECHIRPNLLLIYRKPDDDVLELVRIGSHSELFR
jgi:mRNA interferase YafQ